MDRRYFLYFDWERYEKTNPTDFRATLPLPRGTLLIRENVNFRPSKEKYAKKGSGN